MSAYDQRFSRGSLRRVARTGRNGDSFSPRSTFTDLALKIISDNAFMQPSYSGNGSQYDETRKLEDAYSQVAIVYACVTARARSLSQVPLKLYVVGKDGEREEVESHPLETLIARPNPYTSQSQFVESWEISICRHGQAFVLMDRANEKAIPTALWNLPGNRVEPIKDMRGLPIGWRYKPGGSKPDQDFQPWQILFDKLTDPDDPSRGRSPLLAANIDIQQEWDVTRWNRSFIENGCDPGGRYELREGATITPGQAAEILGYHRDKKTGPDKVGVADVDMGGLSWKPRDIAHKDMSFEQQREFNRRAVQMVLGVPDVLLGISADQNRSTIYGQLRNFWDNVLLTRTAGIEETLWSGLTYAIDGGRYQYLFALGEVRALQTDVAEVSAAVGTLWNASVPMSHIAKVLDLDIEKYDGWDVSYTSGAMIPSDAPRPAPAAAPPTAKGLEIKAPVVFSPYSADEIESAKGWETRVIRPIVKKFQGKVRRWVYELRDETLNRFAEVEGKALDMDTALVTKDKGDPAPRFNPDDIMPPRKEFEERLAKYLQDLYEDAILTGASERAVRLGTEAQITAIRGQVAEHLQDGLKKVTNVVNETIRDQLRESLIKGMDKGETLYDLAGRIKQIHANAQGRSMTIARTEVGRAANYGAMQESEESGIVAGHRWNSALDGATRDAHKAAHGQVRDIGKAFDVGGEALEYPGDPSGSAGNTINCRCVLDPILTEESYEED